MARLLLIMATAGSVGLMLLGYLLPVLGADRETEWLMATFGWSSSRAWLIVIATRKLGHMVGYAMLGLFMFAMTFRTLPLARRALFSVIVILCLAVLDEFIQSRIAWRSGLVSDVVVDVGAAALAIGVAAIRSRGHEVVGREPD